MWAWQASIDKLSIAFLLKNRHIRQENTCSYCKDYPETLKHIFYDYTLAKEITTILGMELTLPPDCFCLITVWQHHLKKNENTIF